MEERNYSERTAEIIDSEARRILDDIYQRVTGILLMRRDPLIRISDELIRKETLERVELDRLVAPERDEETEMFPQTEPAHEFHFPAAQ